MIKAWGATWTVAVLMGLAVPNLAQAEADVRQRTVVNEIELAQMRGLLLRQMKLQHLMVALNHRILERVGVARALVQSLSVHNQALQTWGAELAETTRRIQPDWGAVQTAEQYRATVGRVPLTLPAPASEWLLKSREFALAEEMAHQLVLTTQDLSLVAHALAALSAVYESSSTDYQVLNASLMKAREELGSVASALRTSSDFVSFLGEVRYDTRQNIADSWRLRLSRRLAAIVRNDAHRLQEEMDSFDPSWATYGVVATNVLAWKVTRSRCHELKLPRLALRAAYAWLQEIHETREWSTKAGMHPEVFEELEALLGNAELAAHQFLGEALSWQAQLGRHDAKRLAQLQAMEGHPRGVDLPLCAKRAREVHESQGVASEEAFLRYVEGCQ